MAVVYHYHIDSYLRHILLGKRPIRHCNFAAEGYSESVAQKGARGFSKPQPYESALLRRSVHATR
jgi:hypothetical protein